MDVLEANTHSFIVKIWLEDNGADAGQAEWQGCITHVTGGERRYFKNLNQISGFIMPYLEAMGVKFNSGWWLRRWLKRKN
jgi:hypothetical protein